MYVIKRDGSKEKLDVSKIRKQTKPACEGLPNISFEELELSAQLQFVDGVKTKDIQKTLIETALNKITVDRPQWDKVAARLYTYDVYHRYKHLHNKAVSGDVYKLIPFDKHIEFLNKHNKLGLKLEKFDLKELNAYIKPERDDYFSFLGIYNLTERYTIKVNDEVAELPQYLFMGVAMFLAQNEKDPMYWAKRFYDMMSNFEAMPATPILTHGRRKNGQCFSCYVGSTADNIESIFDTYKEQALISKWGGGIGWDWSMVRALGGIIQEHKNRAKGLIPWLKIENDIAIAVDQLGVRKGSINTYAPDWHLDIFDFLDLKKSGGEERRTAEDLFLGIIFDDVFLERVEKDESFWLFDPYDVPELAETWGDKFRKHYEKYEKLAETNPDYFTNTPKKIKAKDLWKYYLKYYWETGMPFPFFKDNVNRAHAHPEEGIIRTSNLCMEIAQPTDENRTVLCNLGSINLAKVGGDKQKLIETAKLLTRALDNVVDNSNYLLPKHEKVEKHTRAIGVGVMGEAEYLATHQIMYGSKEHEKWLRETYEAIYSTVYETSKELAKEKGPWKEGKETRNAYLGAIAPTGTISFIVGTTSSHEPVFNRIWKEENVFGKFPVTAPNLDVNSYYFYVNAYEIPQERLIELTAIRQEIMNKYLGQAISHNLYFMPGRTKAKDISQTLLKAWKSGVKTLYYLRTGNKKLEEEQMSDTIHCYGCE